MKRFLVALIGAFLIVSSAWADSTPGNLGVATTTLVSGRLPFDQGPGTDTALGFNTTTFDVSAGLLILKAGGVSDAMLASTFLKTSALGTGVGTALGINTGSAGAFVKNNGDALSGTFSGNFTISGVPTLTGLSSGTIAECGGFATASNVLIRGTCPGGGGTITGSGTANTLTKWTGASAIGNSTITDAAGGVVVGSPTGGAQGAGTLNATGLFINGVAAAAGGSGTVNVGTTPQAAYYASSAAAVSGASGVTFPGAVAIAVGSPTGSSPGAGVVDVATGYQVNGVPVAQVVAGTSQTVSAAQWAAGTTFVVTSGSQTLTLPASSTLSANGGIVIQTVGQSVALAPNGSDTINGSNTTATISSGLSSVVTTNAAGAVYATPTTVGAGNVTAAGTLASGGIVIGQGTEAVATASDITFATGILTLGVNTSEIGGVKMFGSSSGNTTLEPSAAAGTTVATLPSNTGIIAELNLAQTWSAVQTVTQGDLALLGSSTGKTTLNSGLASSGNNTLTLPITSTDTLAGLGTVQTFSAAQTFGETHGTTYAPSFTSNNYNVLSSDCGKTLLIPTGTTPTVTMPNVNAACTVVLVQASATQFTVAAASGGTIHSVNSYTKSKAQYAILFLTIIVPSASVAEWALAGDGA